MSDGISILKDNLFLFAIGEYNNNTHATDSVFYIKADDIKYKEGQF